MMMTAPVVISPVFDAENLRVEVADVLVALLVGDGVHQQETVAFAHVLLAHGAELLLPRRVQHCKRDNTVCLEDSSRNIEENRKSTTKRVICVRGDSYVIRSMAALQGRPATPCCLLKLLAISPWLPKCFAMHPATTGQLKSTGLSNLDSVLSQKGSVTNITYENYKP